MDSPGLAWVQGWASPRVRALTTLRAGAGVSRAPFDRFNLGTRCGDDPVAVAANRAQLRELAGLPAEPRWLRQVHGATVVSIRTDPSARSAADAGAAGTAGGSDAPTAPVAATVGRHSETDEAPEPEADSATTTRSGVVLAILTADCLPVVLAARDGSEMAVAHAGWRGLAAGVLEATVAAMRTPAGEVQAWLGPAAGPQLYEVGEEVRAAFLGVEGDRLHGGLAHGARGVAEGSGGIGGRGHRPHSGLLQGSRGLDPEGAARRVGMVVPTYRSGRATVAEERVQGGAVQRARRGAEAAFVATRAGHWLCDLYLLARLRLAAAGVTDVRGGGRCTIGEPDAFFSHRRDGRTGRMATLAWIAG